MHVESLSERLTSPMTVNTMSATEEDVLKMGKTKDAVKIPSEYGGGYMASLEVNHQLHCMVSAVSLVVPSLLQYLAIV